VTLEGEPASAFPEGVTLEQEPGIGFRDKA
jgi:hypothetical protein